MNNETMTTMSNVAPAFLQTIRDGNNNHHGYHHNHGISDKDATRFEASRNVEATYNTSHATAIAVEKTGAASALATEKVGAAAILDASKNTANILLSAQLAATNSNNAIATGFKDAAILSLTQHQIALAQAAECCCEIKEKIAEDGEKTRILMQQFNTASLLAESTKLANENTLLRFRAINPTLPV